MSVPLPSPSPLTPPTTASPSRGEGGASAKAIPRSRPTPISTGQAHSPSSPSFRSRPQPPSSISRSLLNDDNWRDRSPAPTTATASTPSTATTTNATSGKAKVVGGFEKREIKSAGLNAVSGLSANKDKKDGKRDNKDKDEAEGDKALSHVPCRFFKAGACTAGDSCPFSHAAPDAAKREICQWFLKGNCKFGHKCALAHVRPGEPMSMDRKNKKAAQLEARERGDSVGASSAPPPAPSSGAGTGNTNGLGESPRPLGIMRGRKNSTSPGEEQVASPVPIKSALSTSMQSPQTGRLPSSPLREPFGPPSGALPNSPNSAGFAHPRGIQGFASSPSRPSPLSASFGASGSVPGPLSLKASSSNPLGSPLRPPVTTAPGFSSSFSHPSLLNQAHASSPTVPLSASFAGDNNSNLHKSIWTRSDTPDEPLSPQRRRPIPKPTKSNQDAVFIDDEDHGEDFLPSSLSELLTPRERARRMSRRDSQGQEDFASASPSASASAGRYGNALWGNGNGYDHGRLAQSAGPNLGPNAGGFLQSLWSAEGEDARKHQGQGQNGEGNGIDEDGKEGFAFGPSTAQQPKRQTSLLTQQRSPTSPTSPNKQIPSPSAIRNQIGDTYLLRNQSSSPSATKVLQEHLPGQSLPGGLASALSRLHMQNAVSNTSGRVEEDDGLELEGTVPLPGKKVGHHQNAHHGHGHEEEEGLFDMDG
ncbi:hypothetical protein V865_003763 [Kwoniella europaea PYCC6329]|uniref:C3H1-type domain-containing protein n=1 Tax=Kwoniella europaea PYCC6329 TaxID=1423913 RepID=A0AAX4KGZ9_9TREE